MTLPDWERDGWLRRHTSSPQEIGELLAIADRDIADAAGVRTWLMAARPVRAGRQLVASGVFTGMGAGAGIITGLSGFPA